MVRWIYFYTTDADQFETDPEKDGMGFYAEVYRNVRGMFHARSVEIEEVQSLKVSDDGTVEMELIGVTKSHPGDYECEIYYWLDPDIKNPTADDVQCCANPFTEGFVAE